MKRNKKEVTKNDNSFNVASFLFSCILIEISWARSSGVERLPCMMEYFYLRKQEASGSNPDGSIHVSEHVPELYL